MNIILLGPPGSGKGTQAQMLCQKYGMTHISPGELGRRGEDELAKKMRVYMTKGELAPSMLVMKLVKQHLGAHNLFDGFPRSLDQAEKLDEEVHIDIVLELSLSDSEVVKRLSSRIECIKCKAAYGPARKPKKPGICDECGGELVKRKDDTPIVIQTRLEKYHDETEPLLEYYRPRNLVYTVDGSKSIAEVSKETVRAVEAHG